MRRLGFRTRGHDDDEVIVPDLKMGMIGQLTYHEPDPPETWLDAKGEVTPPRRLATLGDLDSLFLNVSDLVRQTKEAFYKRINGTDNETTKALDELEKRLSQRIDELARHVTSDTAPAGRPQPIGVRCTCVYTSYGQRIASGVGDGCPVTGH